LAIPILRVTEFLIDLFCMTNRQIARALKETAALIELTGGNPFRARAFEGAARTIDRLEVALIGEMEAGRLQEIAGIGAGLAAQIRELTERGSFDLRDELLQKVPPGLPQVLRVKGLGVRKVKALWKQLDVTSLDTLEEAATVGRIADLEGFGKKTEQKILEEVRRLRTYLLRRRYADITAEADAVLARARDVEGIETAELAGEWRRALETVGDILVVTAASDPEQGVSGLREAFGVVPQDDGSDDAVLHGELPDSLPLRIVVTTPDRFGTVLWERTGSEEHVMQFIDRFGAPGPSAAEEDVFAAAGCPFILPEIREGNGELETGEMPRLITVDDLKGLLHNHSTYSDGAHTLREMAEATRERGMSYFGISDHSQSLVIANGMSVDDVRRQQEEIGRLNALFADDGGPPFRIFSGIESDVLADGALDYPEDILDTFDIVVASVHQGFNMTAAQATERLIHAVRNPFTTILGHPTGRLLLAREGYQIDHLAVIEACAEEGVAIELNANPYRLDMDWRWIRAATERGVLIAINPDAHLISELDYVTWGVAVARKGWLAPEQCLNAMDLSAFEAWVAAHRARRP
jgi:DNA polymerase (family X)